MLHVKAFGKEYLEQLLEDAGATEAPTVLSLATKYEDSKKHLMRLFELADEVGSTGYTGNLEDLNKRASRMPMVAL